MKQKHRGTNSELRACLWLQENGYEVFKNISSHGEVDLIIWDPDKKETRLIDVTTAHYHTCVNGDKTRQYPKFKRKECLKNRVHLLIVDHIKNEIFWDEEIEKCLLN